MRENAIVKAILGYLRGLNGVFCWKEHGGQYGTAGVPDIICCCEGKFVALEVKVPGNKPTELQKRTLEAIEAAGGVAAVVHSVDEVKEVMSAAQRKAV